MSLRNERNETQRLIIEGKFIDKTLRAEASEINQDIDAKMSAAGFESDFWDDKAFTVSNNTLSYRHKPQHRFVDMKTRNTKEGKIRKKNHSIHNRIIYGHLNSIARELSFGLTDAAIQELRSIEGDF